MKKLLSPSVMFSFILALVMAIVLGSNYYALPDVVPTHWNALGKADSWGEKYTVPIFPAVIVCAVLIVLIARSVLVIKQSVGRAIDSIDVYLPVATAVSGYAAMVILSSSMEHQSPAFRNPVNQFIVAFSVLLVLSAITTVPSKRTLLQEPGNGDCLMKLSRTVKIIWVSDLLFVGVAGLVVAALISMTGFMALMFALIAVFLLLIGVAAAFVISNN